MPMPSKDVIDHLLKQKGAQIAGTLETSARQTFPFLNSYEGNHLPGSPYSVVRHCRPWVYYRGTSTIVPITILGNAPVPPERRVVLQRRGWRTSMFGWKTGAVLGGNYGKGIDVTPEREGVWESEIPPEQKEKIDQDLARYMGERYAPIGQVPQETDFIRIPVSSGDGYFRLVVCPHKSATSIVAATGVFRLGSLSPDSARARGATLATLGPELALKHASNTVQSVAQGAISTIPVVQNVETIPGTQTIGKAALNTGFRRVAGPEMRGRYHSFQDICHHFEDELHNSLSKVNIGIRTAHDLREDEKMGNGGMWCKRSQRF